MMLPAVYNPRDVEARWYREWEAKGYFAPSPDGSKAPFTIVIPPPNVTGILHMGHALNNTLQDILIRVRRMQGYATLWVPGTDHAGIATQNVVERALAKEGRSRQQLGRAAFVERVWAWRKEYGSTIVSQLRRLGASCDWSRERFTMEEGLCRAVEQAFLALHEVGLLYRGYYLVNWCPRCQTALADEEVQHEEVKGHLWYIRYPLLEAGSWKLEGKRSPSTFDLRPSTSPRVPDSIVVATTRPETMLGDVAVAVSPKDPRYESLLGKTLILPLVRRQIPVIADDFVDAAFGTGAVKVTPAHDLNDFWMAQRHGLAALRVIGPDGRMTGQAGSGYAGLDRFECRKKVLANLESAGLLEKTEVYATAIGHCYRCKTVIEPALTPQWFVRMKPLARLGIEAVEKGDLRFIPDRYTRVYLDWLNNIRDWCISRQIWWGHRIPVWYCKRCYPVALKEQAAQPLSSAVEMDPLQAGIHVGPKPPGTCRNCRGGEFEQDEDVLDTWFSSWLWPFSTLGWPQATEDLKRFYPTSVLITGQDILFFWVARMVMAGKFFLKKTPFRDVYIHGIIRVEGGKKMSKSLGNIIDPLEVIERIGADALRFSIAHMASEGQDLYLAENKFLLGRNFANKLWNATRLLLEKLEAGRWKVEGKPSLPHEFPSTFELRASSCLSLADRWILSRLQQAIRQVAVSLEDYRFNDAARRLYQFVWHEFCDWYLEVAKLQQRHVGLEVWEVTLRLLHPFMPFISEELWQKIQARGTKEEGRGSSLMLAKWPQPDSTQLDEQAEAEFGRIQQVVTEVRNIRATFRVPASRKVALFLRARQGAEGVQAHEKLIGRLAFVESITVGPDLARPAGSVVAHLGAWDLMVPLAGLVDLSIERRRIDKEIQTLQSRVEEKRSRLGNAQFRTRAPTAVVAEEEAAVVDLENQLKKWNESLKQLE